VRTTIEANVLAQLLAFSEDGNDVRLEGRLGHLFATTRRSYTHAEAHNDGEWQADLRRPDVPAVLAWLGRLGPDTPVRIGSARLADGTGTLLTLRTGAESLRVLAPATDRIPVAA
jgi:hypothetical protein